MEQMNDNADRLSSIPKVDPFLVPDGFFDRFPHQVQARVASPRARSVLRGYWLPGLAGTLLLLVTFLWWQGAPTTRLAEPFSPMPSDQFVAWSEMVLSEADLNDLLAGSLDGGHALPPPGSGFTLDELEAYLYHAELPLHLITELP